MAAPPSPPRVRVRACGRNSHALFSVFVVVCFILCVPSCPLAFVPQAVPVVDSKSGSLLWYESALFRTRVTTCYPERVEAGPDFVPGLSHVVAHSRRYISADTLKLTGKDSKSTATSLSKPIWNLYDSLPSDVCDAAAASAAAHAHMRTRTCAQPPRMRMRVRKQARHAGRARACCPFGPLCCRRADCLACLLVLKVFLSCTHGWCAGAQDGLLRHAVGQPAHDGAHERTNLYQDHHMYF